VLADIPGLIEGAHEGAGLGDRFLGHVERCRVLLHLVDGTADDVAESYRIVRGELVEYGGGLADKPEIVALNKIDALTDEMVAERRAALEQIVGKQVMLVSGATGRLVPELLRAVLSVVDRAAEAEKPTVEAAYQP
jgi:GTP-binding protein